ncbi:short-chain dehydrogenase/reductase SDR [Chlorobaculum parvum NCIB 8327]|uniref:Short-chain dehydrogenase/reductase SDR n=1 Tax=Chlorobaculum parvum (strain DSM 263 / NCIMB 8327) TaxID=517417 RepID=B3QNJ2_CHLP8|nr:SDR family oxidoreductase [Chlorobaculum parvum]ACF11495.1 short-chain dehydrogenase/reductase SDR [Chlorobaculum parvum NCIB 8327]
MSNVPQSLGVVITGGTAGLGLAMALEFLRAGDRVVICGRRKVQLDEALQQLQMAVSSCEVYGMVCDISDPEQATTFVDFAVSKLGIIHRWINNAGTAGRMRRPLWQLDPHDIDETCRTNLSGSMMVCAAVLKAMLRQSAGDGQPVYHLFNMGFSSAGLRSSPTSVAHRASKRAVALMSELLLEELERSSNRSIGVHELSPGLVLTELLLRDATIEHKRFFNAMAETAETVAARLVPAIRRIDKRDGAVRYQPVITMLLRLVASRFGYRKERFFDSGGMRRNN